MTLRHYDTDAYRWRVSDVLAWSPTRSAWERQTRGVAGLRVESALTPGHYLGQGTVWTRSVASMPLASDSAVLANWMWTQSPTRFNSVTGNPSGAFGAKTSLNTSNFGTHPIVMAVVDSTEQGCRFQYMDTVSGPGMTTAEQDTMIKGAIPWPSGLLPPTSGDKAIAIYDLGTGITREYFAAVPVANKPGHWTATVGGYSVAPPHFPSGPGFNYATQYRGSNAVVRMHNTLGQIGIDEVRSGSINHALGFTMANAVGGVPASWPALASDGKFPPASWSGWQENGGGNGPYPGASPRHGQWGRLPSTVDPEYNPSTGQPYHALTKLIIRAAKTYGLVGTDTNAWCHSFNGESGNREKVLTGVDPWASELSAHLGYNTPDGGATALDVNDFPWNLTQWAPVDWGRPDPDFFLRADEFRPYYPHGGA